MESKVVIPTQGQKITVDANAASCRFPTIRSFRLSKGMASVWT
jgi:hypothetical protein